MKISKIILINILTIITLLILLEISTRLILKFYFNNSVAGLTERTVNLKYEPFVMYGPDWKKSFSNIIFKKDDFKIMIIGGSTAAGIPEKLLKKYFSEITKKNISIFNFAFGGYVSKQQLVLLSLFAEDIIPDLIINLDGANDIIHSLRQNSHGNFFLNKTYDIYLTKPFLAPFVWLIQNSQFTNTIFRIYQRNKTPDFKDKVLFLDSYLNTTSKIKSISNIYSKKYIHILQPHLYFKNIKSEEEMLFKKYNYRNNYIEKSYDYISKNILLSNLPNECTFIDGRDLFKNNENRIFSDDVHFFDDKGYEVIIKEIINCLQY